MFVVLNDGVEVKVRWRGVLGLIVVVVVRGEKLLVVRMGLRMVMVVVVLVRLLLLLLMVMV